MNCFFNSNWTKKQFFQDIEEDKYIDKFGICYQSTKKTNVNLNLKKNIITFIGKLNLPRVMIFLEKQFKFLTNSLTGNHCCG